MKPKFLMSLLWDFLTYQNVEIDIIYNFLLTSFKMLNEINSQMVIIMRILQYFQMVAYSYFRILSDKKSQNRLKGTKCQYMYW